MDAAECGSSRQALVISCVNCERDAEISAATAAAKVEGLQLFEVLELSKRHQEEDRWQSVIADLAPLLLGDDVAATRALRSNRKTFLDALQMLQDAAMNVSDAPLELRCRLIALTHLLPPLPADLADELAHTSAAAGPPPAAVSDPQKAVKGLLTQALSDLAEFVAKHGRAGPVGLHALAPDMERDQIWRELPQVQWRVAVLLERCYWSLCPAAGGQKPPRAAAGRNLNVKEAGRQAALLAAASALCALCELRSAARGKLSRADVSAEEALLRALSDMLAARRALTQQHGMWVKACLTRLAALLQALKEAPSEDSTPERDDSDSMAEEPVSLEARVEGALAQCLHVLYGVDLPQRDPDWGSMEDQVVARVAMRNPEECLEVWRYICPYAESIADDKKALSRLQGVLQAMQKHFPAPPQAVLEAWRPDALLDAPDLDEAQMLHGPRPDTAQAVLAPPPPLLQAVEADKHAGVHGALHHLLLRLQPDLDVLHKDDIALLPAGTEAVQSFVELACYDLRYNPLRYFAWDRIAAMYREAVECIAKVAAADMSVDQWHADNNADLRARLELYQARAARATLVARQLCPVQDAVFQDEQTAVLLHERLQNAPPIFDQLARVPDKAEVQQLASEAAAACERAVEGLPDEWLYHMMLGKMRAKSSCPPEQYLSDLARACMLASVHAGGLVEPLYRLHATRLKLLHQPSAIKADCLVLLARYCFDEEKQQRAMALLEQPASAVNSIVSVQKVVDLLVADGEAAMRWVLEKDRNFHRAHHALARSLQARGSFAEAAEELRKLFTSPKRAFYIGMWEISDRLTKAATGEVERQSSAGGNDSSALTKDDSSWGRQPPRTAGNGLEEPFRKFAACRRRYLIRYLDLLARTGNVASLAAAHSFLSSPQQWTNPALMADIARLALGHCILTLARLLRQQMPALISPVPPAIPPVSTGIPGQSRSLWPVQPVTAHTASMGLPSALGNGHASHSLMVTWSHVAAAQVPASDEALPLLEAAYALYSEQVVLGGPEHGARQWAAALEAVQPIDASLEEWTGEAAFARATFEYINELGRRGNLDELQSRLVSVRKRFKVLRTANERVQGLAARIGAAAAAALGKALDDLERRQAITSVPDQAPSRLQPNQTTSSPPPHPASGHVPLQAPSNHTRSGLPGTGSPRAPGRATIGEVRVAIWQPPEEATPVKAPATNGAGERSLPALATPPPQVAPLAGGQVPTQADTAAQQASLELLRHAHYLYKSGVARLPAAGSSGMPAASSLCRLDELLVRAYKLYRGPQPAGSAAVTAADAAAAYEEMVRATKRASPSGKASGVAARAERAAAEGAGPRLAAVAEEAGREAALQQPEQQPAPAVPTAHVNSKSNSSAQAAGQNVQSGTGEGTVRETAADAAAAAAERPATPLTRKRSRREADVAEATASFGAASRDATTLAARNGSLPAAATEDPSGFVAADKQLKRGRDVVYRALTAEEERASNALEELVRSTDLTVPIRGPASWGSAWAIGAPPAGASAAAAPSGGIPAAAQSSVTSPEAAEKSGSGPAAKRIRHDG